MNIYEQAKPINISQIQLSNQELAFTIKTVTESISPENLKLIDINSIKQMLIDENIKMITIRPIESKNESFICQLNQKKIVLITKTSIKKTKYELTISTLELTINENKADTSVLKGFIKKIEHIGQLIEQEKAIAYGK